MDLDKWLSWVWVPATALAMWFANWVLGSMKDLRRADSDAQVRIDGQLIAMSRSVDEAISALHEKANTIRKDLDAYKLDAERRYVSVEDLAKTESHLSQNIEALTRAIEKLGNRV